MSTGLFIRATVFSAVLVFVARAEQPAGRWRIEEIGVPINAVSYENAGGVCSLGPGGKGTMFYTSYYRSTGAELVGYDFRTKSSVRQRLGSLGGYGLAVGRQGEVYVGGVAPGNLYRYNPTDRQMIEIPVQPFGVEYIWDIAVAPSGVVYCAAGYPKTKLVAFDPNTGKASDLGEMVPGQQYLRSVAADRYGRIWCGIGTTAHLVVYDPADGSKHDVLPAEWAKSSTVYDVEAIGDYVVASVMFDGVLLVYDAASKKVARTVARPKGQKMWMISGGGSGHAAYLWTLPNMDAYRCDLRDGKLDLLVEQVGQVKVVESDRWLHVVNDQDYLAYDLDAKAVVARHRLTEGGDGMDIFTLARGPDGNIYGSTYINMHLFRCDVATKALTDLGKALRWTGQIDSLSLGSDGKIYLGAYTDAVLGVYDPARPWQPGLKSDSNPREIGPIGKGQYRTRANCLGPDGKIYVGSIPSYESADRGALTICDPKTGAMDVRLDFVPGGAVEALVADDQYVYGAGGGEFFVYDPKTKTKRYTENRATAALAVVKDGKVVGTGGGKFFLYDRQTNAVVSEKPLPAGDVTHLAPGPDGLAYGVGPACIVRISPDGPAVDVLASEGGKFAAIDQAGRVYFARGAKLFRCAP